MVNLRTLAEADLAVILEDGVNGFGWPITVTDPAGSIGNMTGYSQDIAQLIDPDTGQAVSGRLASATLRLSSLASEGLTIPKGIADANSRPWVIEFNDINGAAYKFKVMQSNPDRTLGLVVCLLEAYS